jgi:hypothetical protein
VAGPTAPARYVICRGHGWMNVRNPAAGRESAEEIVGRPPHA